MNQILKNHRIFNIKLRSGSQLVNMPNARLQASQSDEEPIRKEAYFISLKNPGNSQEVNWHLAKEEIRKRSGYAPINFFATVALFTLAIILLQRFSSFLTKRNYESWLVDALHYTLLIVVAVFLIRLLIDQQFCRRGLRWCFHGISEFFAAQNKSVWDILELFGGAALLSIAVSVISYFVTMSNQNAAAELQKDKENQAMLVSYIKDLTQLVKDKEYKDLNPDLRVSISTRSLNTIEALKGDGIRQGNALRFASRVAPLSLCESGSFAGSRPGWCKIPANIDYRSIRMRNITINSGLASNTPEKPIGSSRANQNANQNNQTIRDGSFSVPANLNTNSTIPDQYFSGIDVSWSDFSGSDFSTANLTETNLTGADLSKAKFTDKSQLDNADFGYSDLSGADFVGTDLTKVKNLGSARFRDTSFTVLTSFPKGFNPCDYIDSQHLKMVNRGLDKWTIMSKSSAVSVTPRDHFVNQYGCDPFSPSLGQKLRGNVNNLKNTLRWYIARMWEELV